MTWLRRAPKLLWGLLLALAVLFQAGDTFGAGNPVVQIARPYLFSTASWELAHFPQKWLHAYRRRFESVPTPQDQAALVRRYFALTLQIDEAEGRLQRVAAGIEQGLDRPAAERDVQALRSQRAKLQPEAERIMEGMISTVLRQEGISSRALFLQVLWPPVDTSLGKAPRVLIVSPRDRIELQQAHLLDPDITLHDAEALERAVDARNLSSLVDATGGVALYPSLVPDDYSLQTTLEDASHEWTHQFLFFHPLGQAYHASPDMTTINETVADMVGREVGQKVYRRYFATPQELAPRPPSPTPSPSTPQFDFGKEMRETRLTADALLAQGKIQEAEAYMEQRRLFLAQHGYVFRKLNQAFFAFHGTYADQPGAVSPIGGYIRTLRARSPTLRDFLSRVSRYSSYADLKRDVGVAMSP